MTMRIDRLQTIRTQRGISQREFARLCGISETLISKYENGWGDPNVQTLKLMAEALNISTDYLLGIVDDPLVHFGDIPTEDDERKILEIYRSEGWAGVAHLSVEKLAGH